MATILITSGGTRVKLDEVRHVGNMSSGRFGSDIARAALHAGHTVYFLYAKGSVRPDQVTLNLRGQDRESQLLQGIASALDPKYLQAVKDRLYMIEYSDFSEYATLLEKWVVGTQPDITMLAAAVSDYGMPAAEGKISSDQDTLTFTMTRNPKLITRVKEWAPKTLLVGFKLLVNATWSEENVAVTKQRMTALSDLVVVNDLVDIRNGDHKLCVHARPDDDVKHLYGKDLAAKLLRVVEDRVDVRYGQVGGGHESH
jgi:phosphopantothenoylcysteine synthetase/decarboxylase